MFPFRSHLDWHRAGAVGHTVAVADHAEPLLDDADRATLRERRDAYAAWARVRTALLVFLVAGTVLAAAGGLVAAFGLAHIAGPLAAATGSIAGLLSIGYALVNRHVLRIQVDIWGLLALAALRRKA